MDEDERRHVADEMRLQSGRSADPFASAVRATRMPMVVTDPRQLDNPIVFCNDAFTKLAGYERDEILGRNCRFLQGPATSKEDVAKVRRAIEARESIQIDLLNYRKDGSTFWNALLLSPVFDEGELTYFFASQMDVTDRKRAEEHRVLLHRELDHRVKNTLATVQSVVLQTLRSAAASPELADAVSGRLAAIARSHDVMTVEAWATADMRKVIEGALDLLRPQSHGHVTVDGPTVRVKARIATTLSLAMHELGDNALRYGALSSPKGTVRVSWQLADGRLHLEWREAGGPPVSAPTHRGFGARIIERVLAAEFNGTTKLEFAPTGLTATLDAPIADVAVEASEWHMR